MFTLVDNAGVTKTLAYIHGTVFSTGANLVVNDTTGSTVGAFVATSHNVYADARSLAPTLGRERARIAVTLKSASGAGAATFDTLAMTPATTTLFADTNQIWTTGSTSVESSDVYAGSNALELTIASASQNLAGADLQATPFLTWAWKKGSGNGLALKVGVTDSRSPRSGHTFRPLADYRATRRGRPDLESGGLASREP